MFKDCIITAITSFFMTFVFVGIIFLFARRKISKQLEKFDRERAEESKELGCCAKER